MPDRERMAYYERREAAERKLAVTASSPAVRNIHVRLADCYARIVRNAAGQASPS